jgi:hypothetical protein
MKPVEAQRPSCAARICVARTAAGILAVMAMSAPAQAAEWEQNTPYYERDGFLDISEWFDGNSYNPTDESMWRWDDETYDLSEDVGADADNDAWYGYTSRNDDDWFYDYYDPSAYYVFDNDGVYAYGARYIDYDDDGAYDASVSYTDWNGDGVYEDYDYFTYNDKAAKDSSQKRNPDQLKQQLPSESRQQSVTGKIENVKQVRVRGDEHTVVQISSATGDKLAVDLGRKSGVAGLNLSKGSTITVQGPRSRVGDKTVVLAKSVQSGGSTREIDRQRKEITGTVISTHKQQVQGLENVFAIVDVSGSTAAGTQQRGTQQQGMLPQGTQQQGMLPQGTQQQGMLPQGTQPQGTQQQAQQQGTQPQGMLPQGTQQQAQQDMQKPAAQGTAERGASAQPGTSRVAVDLGPAQRLGTEIKPGMSLTFTAVPVKVGDRRMLLAQTIRRDGRAVPIDRRTSVNEQARSSGKATSGSANPANRPNEPANRPNEQPRTGSGQAAGEHNAPGMELQRKPPAAANP